MKQLKQMIKLTLKAIAPGGAEAISAYRRRRLFARQFSKFQEDTKRHLYGVGGPAGLKVLSGPFEGMQYIDDIVWGSITPKWLGSYEIELRATIEDIVAANYPNIIDVGCAEGYYAVGLAIRLPSARVHAFDLDPVARRQVASLASLNGVRERMAVRSACGHRELSEIASGPTLLVCDAEGYEIDLLDPQRCPALAHCDILVELHGPGGGLEYGRMIAERFASTHRIKWIPSIDRAAWVAAHADRWKERIGAEELRLAAEEHRGSIQNWLWMTRITHAG